MKPVLNKEEELSRQIALKELQKLKSNKLDKDSLLRRPSFYIAVGFLILGVMAFILTFFL